jgi:amino acid permease
MSTIPNIMLAYLYQMNLFPIYKGLRNPSDKKIQTLAFLSLFTCFFLYLSIGFFGYATFGGQVNDSNYLEVVAN